MAVRGKVVLVPAMQAKQASKKAKEAMLLFSFPLAQELPAAKCFFTLTGSCRPLQLSTASVICIRVEAFLGFAFKRHKHYIAKKQTNYMGYHSILCMRFG